MKSIYLGIYEYGTQSRDEFLLYLVSYNDDPPMSLSMYPKGQEDKL